MSRFGLILLASYIALGCGGSGGAAPSEPAPAPATSAEAKPAEAKPAEAKPSPTAAPAAASDRIDDPSFELALVPTGSYAVGKLGSFAVSLKPRGVYHVNQDYPIDVSLQASEGLDLPKRELKKADAATFSEQLARFDVPLTPSRAGSHRIDAKVKFAVCTPENCMPDERTLALVLPVE